jgi:hypothetical protein
MVIIRMSNLPNLTKISGSVTNNNTAIAAKPEIKNYISQFQKHVKHEKAEFNAIRNSIKATSDMFLFGEPTEELMTVVLKLYHENLLRIAYENSTAWSLESAHTIAPKLSCMFGILHGIDSTGEEKIYVTISEAPALNKATNFPTDPNYEKKRDLVRLLLKNCNFIVKYPDVSCINNYPISDMFNWRLGHKLKGNQFEKENMLQSVTPYMLNAKTVDEAKSTNFKYLYNEELFDNNIEVNYVDSCQYLQDRKAGNPTFRPFKKYVDDFETTLTQWRADCNNGHLCTESKLFAYAHNNKITVKSFVAYWIGNDFPDLSNPKNKHVIGSYCYEGNSQKLTDLADRCLAVVFDKYKTDPLINLKMKYIVRPMAVACPGCFANIQAYKTGAFVKWNASNCYLPRKRDPTVGGTRHKKRKSHKKTRKMKRRH